MKFGAGADNDPFVKVSSAVNQKSYGDEEMSQATEKKEDLEADVAKHSSKLEAAVARSIVLAGETSALQPQLQCTGNVVDDPVVHVVEKTAEIPLIQRVQKTVEVPRVQFIDRVVDDPAVMQRQACAGEQADEVPDATPFGKANRTKKRRKAEGQDQDVGVERFSDSALPSSQPSLERKVFCASMASSGEEVEEPEQEQAEVRSLVQGGEHRSKEDETDAQGPGSELVQVAPNMGAGGSHP